MMGCAFLISICIGTPSFAGTSYGRAPRHQGEGRVTPAAGTERPSASSDSPGAARRERQGGASAGGPWEERFDQYPEGTWLHGIDGWQGWDNNPAFAAAVTAQQSLSPLHSVDIQGDADLVHRFFNASPGQWTFSTWQFVPGPLSDSSWFIMQNTYENGGPYHWSVQVEFDPQQQLLFADVGGGPRAEMPYIVDQWVPIDVVIDLDADLVEVFYNGQPIAPPYSWTAGIDGQGGGQPNIATVDLFAAGSSSVFYDDMILVPMDPPPPSAWEDDFDQYQPGQGLHGIDGWEGWNNDPQFDGVVTDAFSHTNPNSVEIAGAADLVQEFSGVDSGLWVFDGWTYVPSAHTGGDSIIMLLNTYQDGGPHNWSTQVNFNNDQGIIWSWPDRGELPLITDQWVPIHLTIDFDNDTQTFLYDGQELYTKSWTEGVTGDGALDLGALDLFAFGTTAVYYDTLSLTPITGDPIGACCLPEGGCADGLTGSECGEAGGEFQGPRSTCEDSGCGSHEVIQVFSDPRIQTDYDLTGVGTGLGRSPVLTSTGRVYDNPTTGVTEVSGVGRTISNPDVVHPPGDVIPGEGDSRAPGKPSKKECEPPFKAPGAGANSSPTYNAPVLTGGNLSANESTLVNAVDLGLGVGWNHATSVVLYDAANDEARAIMKDSSVVSFRFDEDGGWLPSYGAPYSLQLNWPDATIKHINGTTYRYLAMTPAIALPGAPMLLQSATSRNGHTTTYTYQDGKLVSITDPAGRQILLTHHEDAHVASITDEVDRTVQFEYDDDDLVAIVLPNGDRIEYTYDEFHRMTSKTTPRGATYEVEFDGDQRTLYGSTGRRIVSVNAPGRDIDLDRAETTGELSFTPYTAIVTDGLGNEYQYDHNARGQIVRVVNPLGDQTLITYDTLSGELASINTCGLVTRFEYDGLGNLISRTDADGNVSSGSFDPGSNRLIAWIQPDGDRWEYEYDNNGNLIRVIDPIVEMPVDAVVTYAYDSMGNRTRATDRNGNSTEFEYNQGLVTRKIVDPGGLDLVTQYEYDSMGRLIRQIDPIDTVTQYEYDFINRITRVITDVGDDTRFNATTDIEYDANGNRVSMTRPSGTVTRWEYDARDLLIGQTEDAGGLDIVTRFEYDDNDNLVRQTDAEDGAAEFVYDALNRIISTIDPAGHTSAFEYDCAGNVTEEVDANGVATEYVYDSLDRMIRETKDPGGLNLVNVVEYAEGDCGCGTPGQGLVHKTTDPAGRVSYNYYDALDRLVAAVRKVGDTEDNGGDDDDEVTIVEYDAKRQRHPRYTRERPGPRPCGPVRVRRGQSADFAYPRSRRRCARR